MKILIFTTFACLAWLAAASSAEVALPKIHGKHAMDAGAPFQYGDPRGGIRIGLSSSAREYRLNHRINVWTSLEVVGPVAGEHTLMSGDPLYKDSLLFITHPDGSGTKHAIGGHIDGSSDASIGSSRSGGCSDMLHALIRKPGAYKLQWKIGKLESGAVTFTMLAE